MKLLSSSEVLNQKPKVSLPDCSVCGFAVQWQDGHGLWSGWVHKERGNRHARHPYEHQATAKLVERKS